MYALKASFFWCFLLGTYSTFATVTTTTTKPVLVCNADNCLRPMRATQTPGRLAAAQAFCSFYTTKGATIPTPTYLPAECVASRISSACSCIATSIPITSTSTSSGVSTTTVKSTSTTTTITTATISSSTSTTTSNPPGYIPTVNFAGTIAPLPSGQAVAVQNPSFEQTTTKRKSRRGGALEKRQSAAQLAAQAAGWTISRCGGSSCVYENYAAADGIWAFSATNGGTIFQDGVILTPGASYAFTLYWQSTGGNSIQMSMRLGNTASTNQVLAVPVGANGFITGYAWAYQDWAVTINCDEASYCTPNSDGTITCRLFVDVIQDPNQPQSDFVWFVDEIRVQAVAAPAAGFTCQTSTTTTTTTTTAPTGPTTVPATSIAPPNPTCSVHISVPFPSGATCQSQVAITGHPDELYVYGSPGIALVDCAAACLANAACKSMSYGPISGAGICILYPQSVAAYAVPTSSTSGLYVWDRACWLYLNAASQPCTACNANPQSTGQVPTLGPVVNPSFEYADLVNAQLVIPGWTVDACAGTCSVESCDGAYAGSYYFKATGPVRLYQDLTLTYDAYYRFDFWVKNSPGTIAFATGPPGAAFDPTCVATACQMEDPTPYGDTWVYEQVYVTANTALSGGVENGGGEVGLRVWLYTLGGGVELDLFGATQLGAVGSHG